MESIPKNVRVFADVIANQIKGNWRYEDMKIIHENDGWKVKCFTNDVSFYFTEEGEFKFICNFKD